MIAKPKIGKTRNGTARSISTDVVVFCFDDVNNDQYPKRDDGGVKMVGNIPFYVGKYITELYATSTSIKIPRTSEGEEDMVGFTGTPEISHPGSTLEIEEFIMWATGKALGIGLKDNSCAAGDSFYRVYGSPCNPLSLLIEGQNDSEGAKDLLKFQQFKKSEELPGRYYGTWQRAEANVVVADTTEVDVELGSFQYQLSDNTTATVIAGLLNAVDGKVYTLNGSGGVNPATIEATNAKFILKEGVDWQGVAGSSITVKAYATASDFVYIEQSRV